MFFVVGSDRGGAIRGGRTASSGAVAFKGVATGPAAGKQQLRENQLELLHF